MMQNALSRNGRCPCGSGKRFKHCCGSVVQPLVWNLETVGAVDLKQPDNAHLVADEPACANFPSWPAGIYGRLAEGNAHFNNLASAIAQCPLNNKAEVVREGKQQRDHQRVTDIVDIGSLQSTLNELVRAAFQEVADFFHQQMKAFESPQVLRYRPGGYYRPHADADAWQSDRQQWRRTLDRDLSLLIYLDDDYEGGELVFPNFGFSLRPQSGLIVAFPSDYRYLHGAMPVSSGIRHAIVSWGTVHQPPA